MTEPHAPGLIATIAIALVFAFAGGFLARRLRLPPIVGYLLAGVAIGPSTPGLIADVEIAAELAEIGVILLMFGVGIHFSLRDLAAVRSIAVPGAVGQVAVATSLGVLLGFALGWGLGGGLVLGLSVSVASTVVLLRALLERRELDTTQGRIAVGWLIVEDLVTVLVLVALPSVATLIGPAGPVAVGGPVDALADVTLALAKAAVLAVLVVVVGSRVVPWLLLAVARDGSRELFTLAVLAAAMGIAFASSELFGVSLALGAFLAGAVLSESDLSHQAAADALPLRDAFAVLFFVSVGMLVDPFVLLQQPFALLAVILLIVGAKAAVAIAIVLALRRPVRVALTVGAGDAQIGEFSFIVAALGTQLGLLPPEGFQLVAAGSLISITLNPLLFAAIDPLSARLRDRAFIRRLARREDEAVGATPMVDSGERRLHAVLCGYGRVGRLIGGALDRRGLPYVVIDEDRRRVEEARAQGIEALYGDAADRELLHRARIDTARVLIVAISDAVVAQLVVERAHAEAPRLDIVVRSHSEREAGKLRRLARVVPVLGERELAIQMSRFALRRFGVSGAEVEAIAQGLRSRPLGTPGTPSAGMPGATWMSRTLAQLREAVSRQRPRRSAREGSRDAASAGAAARGEHEEPRDRRTVATREPGDPRSLPP